MTTSASILRPADYQLRHTQARHVWQRYQTRHEPTPVLFLPFISDEEQNNMVVVEELKFETKMNCCIHRY